ncbi:MAG: HlyD family efflux transporter periplasmic adaptor subunit [Bacteroidota bacterium]|nr:MAG: HlyD family efflux transporter periplasmic adaptor subunit [Bacteroidota bacterium]
MENNNSKANNDDFGLIQLRSEEVNEIIGIIPSRIVRFGISIITLIIIGLIIFSIVFRYPDVIEGEFFIQTTNPPAFLLAKSTGKVQYIFVADSDSVKVNQLLAIIENPVNYEGYLAIDSLVKIDKNPLDISRIWATINKPVCRYGQLYDPLSTYMKSIEEYQNFKNIDTYTAQEKHINKKIKDLRTHITLLSHQVATSKENLRLANSSFKRDSVLYSNDYISALNYENSQKELINQKIAQTNAEIQLSNVKLTLSDYQQDLIELEKSKLETEAELLSQIKQNLNNLIGKVSSWENDFCIISPIDGVIAFSKIWQVNQNILQGQHIMTVVPSGKSAIVGRIYIPLQSSGKVKPQQLVNLKFTDYPYNEFGMVVCRLAALSTVPDSVYIGTILLPDSLKTNYDILLPFRQNMQGVAEIITEDLSLAERILYPLKAIYNKQIR